MFQADLVASIFNIEKSDVEIVEFVEHEDNDESEEVFEVRDNIDIDFIENVEERVSRSNDIRFLNNIKIEIENSDINYETKNISIDIIMNKMEEFKEKRFRDRRR
jgi:hypothetical protein